jgi:hypothetical protein
VSGHISESKLFVKRVWTYCPSVRTSARKTFLCPLSSLECPNILQNMFFLEVAFAGMSGHVREQDFIVTCVRWDVRTCWEHRLTANHVQTRLLAIWTSWRKFENLGTNNYVEYFPNHCSFLSWLIFYNTLFSQLFHFVINILQYSFHSALFFFE